MALDLTLRIFLNETEFKSYIHFFYENWTSLEVREPDRIDEPDRSTLVQKKVLLNPDDQSSQKLSWLSAFYFKLLSINKKFLNISDLETVTLIGNLDKYDCAHRLGGIYKEMLARNRQEVHETPKQKKENIVLPSFRFFPLPIVDVSRECWDNSLAFLQGKQREWSFSEVLDMSYFLFSQTLEKEALLLFTIHALPYLFEDPEKFSQEIQEFLQRKEKEAGAKSDKEETRGALPEQIRGNVAQAIGQLLKAKILEDGNAFKALPDSLRKWVLSEEIAKDLGEYECLLGYCCYFSRGTALDYAKAFKLFQRSAELGCAHGYLSLGDCYRYGRGIAQDLAQIFKHYERAAELGCGQGFLRMGTCCWLGVGAAQDHDKAFEYFYKAAELGCAEGDECMGQCYLSGKGAPRHYAQAFKCFKRAAELGYAHSYLPLGDCYKYGKGVPQDYNKALECYKRATTLGCSQGYVYIGDCYWSGEGVSKDDVQAFKHYAQAANLGCGPGCTSVGECYWFGRGVLQDAAKAFEYFGQAAKLGWTPSYEYMGNCYWFGRGVSQDAVKAFEHYQRAAELGWGGGYVKMGDCYRYGKGAPQDYNESFKKYHQAMSLGNIKGKFEVAKCFTFGKGTEENRSKAKELLLELISDGYTEAKNFYAENF